jgi:hypothetical protein
MVTSIRLSVTLCMFLIGCGTTVQVGLANAPLLINGGTPENRVHDVIANGHDACERSAFPPGEVLRGQIPPCNPTERLAAAPAFLSAPPPPPPSTPLSSRYTLDMCPSAGPGFTGTENGMRPTSVSPSSSELVCNEAR